MDIKKELDQVQKKIDEIKKSQETLKKIADLQEKQEKKMAKRPYSGGYEMIGCLVGSEMCIRDRY